jgi:glucose/arabinose dehydrogenase
VYVLYAYDYLGIEGTCTDFTGNGCMARGRLSRLEADVSGGPVMTGVEQVLLEDWCQQFPSHSTGDLDFGFDGALYVSGGDGASFNYVDYGQTGNRCNDPPSDGGALRSQDLKTSADPTSLDGTILRVDPATGAALPDNPLYGGAVADDDRIIAHGLRNPFRITVRPGTLEVWIGDVGWSTREEINVVRDPLDAVIENFGWPCYEGNPRQSGYDNANLPICENIYVEGAGAVTAPHYAYVHAGTSAITGVAFHEASNYPPEYTGALFFADYSARWIKVMYLDGAGEPDPTSIDTFRSNITPVDLQLGPDGNIYYVNLGTDQVRRFEYFSANQPPIAVAKANVTNGASPLLVQFDASGSSDPDVGDTLDYAWDLDGDGQFDDSTLVDPQHTYPQTGSFLVRLRVNGRHPADSRFHCCRRRGRRVTPGLQAVHAAP